MMTNADDFAPADGRRARRVRVGAGVAGIAAVLGVGAYAVTDYLLDKPEAPVAQEAGRTAQVVPDSTVSSPASPAPSPSATKKQSASPAGPVIVAMPKAIQSRLDDARSANKRLGTGARHPLPLTATNIDPSQVKVVQTGSNQEGRTLKVASAALDLTGYRELAWVHGGERHGDVTCTQTITVSPDVPPKVKPTLLICYRTSAKKSVYTVAVDFKGHPSVPESVAALGKAWSAMS